MISAGRFRQPAEVLRAATTVDALGRRSTTYTNVGKVRVDVRPSQGSEQFYADGVSVVSFSEIRMRWPDVARLSITAVDRLLFRTKTLAIESIVNLENRDRVAVISAREVA